MDSQYLTSAAKAEQLPQFNQPEIAFFGRSNTGKSTLINTLLQRRNLARTSRTPGRTQMINFFSVNNKIILADLPGYGYSQAQQDISRHWQRLVDAYIERRNLSETIVLLDARRLANDEDMALMQLLAAKDAITVVLTKADKISRAAGQSALKKLAAQLESAAVAYRHLHACSSLKKQGIRELWSDCFEPYLVSEESN